MKPPCRARSCTHSWGVPTYWHQTARWYRECRKCWYVQSKISINSDWEDVHDHVWCLPYTIDNRFYRSCAFCHATQSRIHYTDRWEDVVEEKTIERKETIPQHIFIRVPDGKWVPPDNPYPNRTNRTFSTLEAAQEHMCGSDVVVEYMAVTRYRCKLERENG